MAAVASFESQALLIQDLADVCEVAQILVNGQLLDTLWKPPYRCDISSAFRPERNTLEIRVTCLRGNRLVPDQQTVTLTSTTVSGRD
jgi:hypothetical protein